jgi:recombination protein RecR
MYPKHLNRLIAELKKFPGVGSRSSERFAFQLLNWSEEERQQLANSIATTGANLQHCQCCGSLIDLSACPFCDGPKRDLSRLCIVATAREVFSLEETRQYRGLYHVLGGTLSPLQGRGPDNLRFEQLWPRLSGLDEVIIALDSTLEGDATALYIKKELDKYSISSSRLAFGLPSGCSIEVADEGTLTRALMGRR